MSGIEKCANFEGMPHLEPLTGPNSEVNSLRDMPVVTPLASPSVPPPCPAEGTLNKSVATSTPKQGPDSNMAQFMRCIAPPFKLRLVLENKGNVARDHLASERTYLAYVRTSLACASAGVALVQLFALSASSASSQESGLNLSKYGKPLGATIILFGLIILIFGLVRYFTTQSALIGGRFPVARNSITAIAFVLGILVIVLFSILLAGK